MAADKQNRRTLYITPDTYNEALKLAEANKMSLSTAVRLLLQMWIDGKVSPQPANLPK